MDPLQSKSNQNNNEKRTNHGTIGQQSPSFPPFMLETCNNGSTLDRLEEDAKKAKEAARAIKAAVKAAAAALQQLLEEDNSAMHCCRLCDVKPLLAEAAKALQVFETLSNTPRNRNNNNTSITDSTHYSADEYPVFSAVQDFRSALTDLESAWADLESALTVLDKAKSGEDEARSSALANLDRAEAEEQEARSTLAASTDQRDLQRLSILAKIVSCAATTVVDTEKILAGKASLVSSEVTLVDCKATLVDCAATLVSMSARSAFLVLHHFASLRNNRSSATSQSQPSVMSSGTSSEEPMPVLQHPSYSMDPITCLLRNPKPFTLPNEVLKVGFPPTFGEFTQYLEALMNEVKLVNEQGSKNIEGLKENIATTVTKILRFPEEDNRNADLFAPLPPGLENHPILEAILSTMMTLVGHSRKKRGGSVRNDLHRERSMHPCSDVNESERFDDVALSQDMKGTPTNALLDLPIVAKALGRIHLVLAEAMRQVVGRLCKRLKVAFDFGGLGVDCAVTGTVITLVHVEIVQLSLVGMGLPMLELSSNRRGNCRCSRRR